LKRSGDFRILSVYTDPTEFEPIHMDQISDKSSLYIKNYFLRYGESVTVKVELPLLSPVEELPALEGEPKLEIKEKAEEMENPETFSDRLTIFFCKFVKSSLRGKQVLSK
jgi:hypothetical protein